MSATGSNHFRPEDRASAGTPLFAMKTQQAQNPTIRSDEEMFSDLSLNGGGKERASSGYGGAGDVCRFIPPLPLNDEDQEPDDPVHTAQNALHHQPVNPFHNLQTSQPTLKSSDERAPILENVLDFLAERNIEVLRPSRSLSPLLEGRSLHEQPRQPTSRSGEPAAPFAEESPSMVGTPCVATSRAAPSMGSTHSLTSTTWGPQRAQPNLSTGVKIASEVSDLHQSGPLRHSADVQHSAMNTALIGSMSTTPQWGNVEALGHSVHPVYQEMQPRQHQNHSFHQQPVLHVQQQQQPLPDSSHDAHAKYSAVEVEAARCSAPTSLTSNNREGTAKRSKIDKIGGPTRTKRKYNRRSDEMINSPNNREQQNAKNARVDVSREKMKKNYERGYFLEWYLQKKGIKVPSPAKCGFSEDFGEEEFALSQKQRSQWEKEKRVPTGKQAEDLTIP